jgi:hypothetical protein
MVGEDLNVSNAGQGMETYRETAVAFDNLIVQVGRAIAAAQESMDQNQVQFQRQIAQALKEGKLRRLDVPPMNAYAMPETTLYLKMGLSIDYSEESKGPALSALPLNATTTNQNDIDIESATEIRLRFVSVPQTQEPPGPGPSALTAEQVQEIVEKDQRFVPLKEELEKLIPQVNYKEDSRLWIVVYLEAREARLVVLVDDRTAKVAVVIDQKMPTSDDDLAPIQAPLFHSIQPASGKQGNILTLYGDNFLTLAGQTQLFIDGRPLPALRLSMNAISFKLPGWAINGDIKITTPLGSVEQKAVFTPIPRFDRFQPTRGGFDALRQHGTWVSVYGSNLGHGCTIEFATGAKAKNVQVISPGQINVEIPENAGTGPLTLVSGDFRQSLGELFFMLPRVDNINPRQARVGEEVTLTGNTLAAVSEIQVGNQVISYTDFNLHTPTRIRFTLPPGASDGPIKLREIVSGSGESSEISTRDIFYVVPRITGFGSAVGLPGGLLTIYGEGLDPDPDMMLLLFEAVTGISEAPVLAVAPDRKSLTTRVPLDAATGFVLLLRKRVYSESSPIDTSDLSVNKLTVLTMDGSPADLVLDERFGTLDPDRWTPETGFWSIDDGMLAGGEGAARLKLTQALNLDQFTISADILGSECFGFSMAPTGGSTYLQVWLDLLSAAPALTWSRIDSAGDQHYLGGIPLAILSGQNHLVQLKVQKITVEEQQLLELTLLLDQEAVHSYRWNIQKVGTLALLAHSPAQRWDNVILLKTDTLSLPEPSLYRFGEIPELPELPALRVESFEPAKGAPGTEIKISGLGLDEAARFLFGGVEAQVLQAAGTFARVVVPPGARTGPIEVQGRGGAIVTTLEQSFLVSPRITGLAPQHVLAGSELRIFGDNLPTQLDTFTLTVLGHTAQVTALSPTMMTVSVPGAAGQGKVILSYEGFIAEAPSLLEVNQENILLDMVEQAGSAAWTSSAGQVTFGVLSEDPREPSVQMRASERLEDDRVYGPVLYVTPPAPDLRSLKGTYPQLELPTGRIELRLDFGMLWSAAPAPDEAADADGVLFEVSFKLAETGEEIPLLSRIACVHDGSLEHFVIDASNAAGKKGQLILSILAGRTGLRDEAAVIKANLVHVT